MAEIYNYLQHESLFRGDIHKRSSAMILLCGAGAIGSWLADLLARQGYHQLTVLDMDKVDDSNFGTQNYGKSDVGRKKASQLAANIYRRVGVQIGWIDKKLTSKNAQSLLCPKSSRYTLVVDSFDNMESRELLHQTCKQLKIPCLHAGVAAMGYFEVRWDKDYVVPRLSLTPDTIPCEYPMAANLVLMCVAVTAEAINCFIDKAEKRNFEFWLNSMSLEVS